MSVNDKEIVIFSLDKAFFEKHSGDTVEKNNAVWAKKEYFLVLTVVFKALP